MRNTIVVPSLSIATDHLLLVLVRGDTALIEVKLGLITLLSFQILTRLLAVCLGTKVDNELIIPSSTQTMILSLEAHTTSAVSSVLSRLAAHLPRISTTSSLTRPVLTTVQGQHTQTA